MAKVQVTNVTVLDNPTAFFNPFQFEITFECLEDLQTGTYVCVQTICSGVFCVSVSIYSALCILSRWLVDEYNSNGFKPNDLGLYHQTFFLMIGLRLDMRGYDMHLLWSTRLGVEDYLCWISIQWGPWPDPWLCVSRPNSCRTTSVCLSGNSVLA